MSDTFFSETSNADGLFIVDSSLSMKDNLLKLVQTYLDKGFHPDAAPNMANYGIRDLEKLSKDNFDYLFSSDALQLYKRLNEVCKSIYTGRDDPLFLIGHSIAAAIGVIISPIRMGNSKSFSKKRYKYFDVLKQASDYELQEFCQKVLQGLSYDELDYEETVSTNSLEGELNSKSSEIDETVRLHFQKLIVNPTLGKLDESCVHKLKTFLKDRPKNFNGIKYNGSTVNVKDGLADVYFEVLQHSAVFLIKHDWREVFKKASDYSGGEVKLPYDDIVFELRINGYRTICQFHQFTEEGNSMHGKIVGAVISELGDYWVLLDHFEILGNNFDDWRHREDSLHVYKCQNLTAFVVDQIKAICVSLDMELTETQVFRAPHKLNSKRIKAGKLPLSDFHVVDLSRRHRLSPNTVEENSLDEVITRKRLHCVRGHYRHYINHKTWIKWHWRGNPDFGYIDKHYKL